MNTINLLTCKGSYLLSSDLREPTTVAFQRLELPLYFRQVFCSNLGKETETDSILIDDSVFVTGLFIRPLLC